MKRVSIFQIAFIVALLALLVSSEMHVVRAADPSPTTIPVVFIPGIGGTRLADSNNVEYWTDAGGLSHNDLTLYPSQSPLTLYPTNAITEATFLGIHISYEDWQTYGPLFSYFSTQGFIQYNTHQDPTLQTSAGCDLSQASNHPNLFVFAYDWRISNATNATKLADYIACVQKFYPNTNVNLVAHSMGGLVARRYILQYDGAHHVNALVSVSSPYLGSGKVVWVEETGQYVFFVWASTLLDVVGSFNGASELLNSQAWYDMGGAPALVENGQDLNGNGKTNEKFSYSMLVDYMNTAKGKEGFLPGTQNQTFHSYTNNGNSQDDWRNDTTGVKYFHIVGAGLVPDTINQVVAGSLIKCLQNYSTCDLSTWMYPKFTQGDRTVPLMASERISGTLNYNAPNATVYECQAFGAGNRNVDHTGMLSNPVVQNLITGYLKQSNGGPTVSPPPSLACGQGQQNLAPGSHDGKYHRVELSGATDIQVSDGTSDQFPDSVSHFDAGEKGSTLILGSGKTYTVSFKTTNQRIYLEWTYRNEREVRRAVRFLDLSLNPNRTAEFTLTNAEMSGFQYDSDGDGAYDTILESGFDLKGAKARDVRPPKLEYSGELQANGKRLVTLAAKDNTSGIFQIVYSLDRVNFQVYTGPFEVDATQQAVFVFADDAAGNRSPLKRFKLH